MKKSELVAKRKIVALWTFAFSGRPLVLDVINSFWLVCERKRALPAAR